MRVDSSEPRPCPHPEPLPRGRERGPPVNGALQLQTFEQCRREITFGEVRNDDHDVLVRVLWTTADVDRRRDRGPRRNAHRNALQPRDQPRGVERGLIADGDDLVDDAAIEDGGRETGADPLDFVWTRRAAGENG